jgi:mannose-6-phosphate isomerase-like protein (cupin superfamily)
MSATVVRSCDGVAFEDGPDRGRVLVFGHQTDGRYSLMEITIAPRQAVAPGETVNFGPHLHREIEETFLIRRGRLRFLLDRTELDIGPGDFVRVPPGVRHGFANLSKAEVEMLVSFHPGGFEELFVTHRSDQTPAPPPNGFVDEATGRFASEFEV